MHTYIHTIGNIDIYIYSSEELTHQVEIQEGASATGPVIDFRFIHKSTSRAGKGWNSIITGTAARR